MNEQILIQQGDVLFFSSNALPENLTVVKNHKHGLVTFAEGEATGHHHSSLCNGVTLYEDSNKERWCKVEHTTTVNHQEHKSVTLSPGIYKIGIVREYDPFEREIWAVRD